MIWLLAGVAVGVALMFAAGRLGGVLRRRRNLPVVVTMKTGVSFKGVLAADDREALVLRHAEAIEAEGKYVPVDGELILPWRDVKFLQRP